MRPINPKITVLFGKNGGRRFLAGEFGEVNGNVPPRSEQPPFQSAREDRRFAEFADTVRTHRYIGLWWRRPGVAMAVRPPLRRRRRPGTMASLHRRQLVSRNDSAPSEKW